MYEFFFLFFITAIVVFQTPKAQICDLRSGIEVLEKNFSFHPLYNSLNCFLFVIPLPSSYSLPSIFPEDPPWSLGFRRLRQHPIFLCSFFLSIFSSLSVFNRAQRTIGTLHNSGWHSRTNKSTLTQNMYIIKALKKHVFIRGVCFCLLCVKTLKGDKPPHQLISQ